jgi:hypothetical protein
MGENEVTHILFISYSSAIAFKQLNTPWLLQCIQPAIDKKLQAQQIWKAKRQNPFPMPEP